MLYFSSIAFWKIQTIYIYFTQWKEHKSKVSKMNINTLTIPFSLMFFKSGKWQLFRSRRDLIPVWWTMAIRYRSSICLLSHFKSGSKMKPISGLESSNTTRSVSDLCSSMLMTHWKQWTEVTMDVSIIMFTNIKSVWNSTNVSRLLSEPFRIHKGYNMVVKHPQ